MFSGIPSARLGRVVRTLRQDAGLSQEALADAADLHRTALGNIEPGRSTKGGPGLDAVERIAGVFDRPASELVRRAERQSD
jgi:transcriptional regulator with XRE-family HTH domain